MTEEDDMMAATTTTTRLKDEPFILKRTQEKKRTAIEYSLQWHSYTPTLLTLSYIANYSLANDEGG